MADENKPKVSLTDLADIDIVQVDEIRFEVLPQISGSWKVKECKIEAIGKDEKAAIIVIAQPIDIVAVVEEEYKDEEKRAKLLDKEHREAFFVNEAEDVGRFKAFIVDAGVTLPDRQSGEQIKLGSLCNEIVGMEFPGKIVHRFDKTNTLRGNLRPIVTKPEAKK